MRSDVRHALLIAAREYLENVRTRGFWLSLLLLPVVLAVLSIVPIMLADSVSTSDYAVLDHSGWVDPEVQKQAALFSGNPDIRYEFTLVSNIYSAGLPPIEAGSVVAEKAVEILNSKAAGNRLESILDDRDRLAWNRDGHAGHDE